MNIKDIIRITLILVTVLFTITFATAQSDWEQTPFLISGSITYDDGDPVLAPIVTVTNLATYEDFTVETDVNSNYYLTLTGSAHVSVNDTIRIYTSDGSVSSETDHPVTVSDLETGGFVQDMTIGGGGLPDLTVTEKSEEWISLEDLTYNVTYTVANTGTSDAGASNTTIEIDETWVATDPVPALATGENYTSTIGPFTLSDNNDTIKVCADSDEDIIELDETNNCLSNVLGGSGLPDLTVTEKSEEWISLENLTYNVTYTVANIGTSDADACNTRIEIDETVVETDSMPALAAGANYTNTLGPFTLSGDNDTIMVCADSNGTIIELDETNNCLSNVLEGSGLPDLIVWVALKTPGYVNEDNILGVRVKNTGLLDAGSFNVSLSIDGAPVLSGTIPSLAVNETAELEYQWTPNSTGGYALNATADTNNDVEEFDETNNDYARTSVIIKPTDWPQFHYDDVHSGFSPSGAPDTNETLWISDDIGAVPGSSTVVAEGKIFVYSSGALKALDEFSGDELWNVSIPVSGLGSWHSPSYHDGCVFITAGTDVYCRYAADGSEKWTWAIPSGYESCNGGTTVADGKVIVGDWDGGHYYCIDEETAELLWTFTGSAYTQGKPAYADGKLYLTTWAYPGGHVYCVNANTGAELWNQTTPEDTCGSASVSTDLGLVYVTTYDFFGPGSIYALYTTNGTIKWSHEDEISGTDSTPAIAYGNVYVATGCLEYSDIQTHCFNATNGTPIWETNASDEIGGWTSSVAVADGKVFVGHPDSFFDYSGTFALDALTGDLIWSYSEGGSSPAVADNIVFTIGGGRVYAFYSEPQEPDLTVIAIETPVNLRNDVINPISAMIENIGGSAAENFDVLLEVDGDQVDTATITTLGAGENVTVEFLWTPDATGGAALIVTADADNSIEELDETNNDLSETVDILPKLTVTTNVRIEGKDDTVWTGDVTFSSSMITASDGSVHYLNEPTAIGALDEADKSGGFGYVVESHSVYGLYVSEVNNEPAIEWDGWMYRVNYVSPWVGAADYTLTDSDEVLWYFGAWTAPPLAIELNKTAVDIGEEFVATITAYNSTSMAFEPVDGAEIYVDDVLHGLTGTDGTLTLSLGVSGIYQIHADKGTWANYTRSGKESVNVATSALKVDIGDYVVTEGSSIVAPITVYGIEDYGTTTLSIEYNSSVAWVTSVDGTANSTISSSNTNNPAGIVTLSAWNTDGVSGDVVIAYVTFEARGSSGSLAPLNLSVLLMKDTSYNNVPTWDEDGSFTVREDVMPVVGSPQSSPDTILNDNGRARVPGTNLSTLSVSVTDNAGIASVTIDLSPIGGNATQPMTPAGGTIWSVVVNATAGINENHYLGVNATDTSGNSNTGVSVSLGVLRRGDVVRDNEVDILDAYYIARYSVGLEPAPDQFVADVSPANQWDGVDIVDAFYIARYDVGLEDAP